MLPEAAGRHLPHDRRGDVPRRGRRGRPAHGLRAAGRLPGRGRGRCEHDREPRRRPPAAAPRDGTVLRGLPSKQPWEIVGGKRRQTFVSVSGGSRSTTARSPLIPAAVTTPGPGRSRRRSSAADLRRLQGQVAPHAVHGARACATCRPARRSSSPAAGSGGCPYKKKTATASRARKANVVSRFKAAASARLHADGDVTGSTGARKHQTSRSARQQAARCARPSCSARRQRSSAGADQVVLRSSSSCSAWAAPSRNAQASSICSRSPTIPKSTRFL